MKKKMSNLSNLPLQKGQVISYLPVPLFFWRGKKGCYLSWKLKAFCKWMVGILVSLWDFEWILPIFKGELLVSRGKNAFVFIGGASTRWSFQDVGMDRVWPETSTGIRWDACWGGRFGGDLLQLLPFECFHETCVCGLFTPCHCTSRDMKLDRESSRVFFTPSMITCWSS